MMRKRIKQGGALVLAFVLLLGTFTLSRVQAALAVDTERKCSVQVNVSDGHFKELDGMNVTVDLYKVAEMSEFGAYTLTPAFAELTAIEEVSSDTTAADWEHFAVLAKEIVDAGEVEKAATGTTSNGTILFEGLDVGLYLIDAQPALSDTNEYTFKPSLISVPNNYYHMTGNDEWVYDLTGENAVTIKSEKTDRYGDLEIIKILDVFNETIGGATFVFQIEAVKTDIDTGEEKVVYSDVVSMTFHGPGTDSLVIEGIPAGAVVTVTEIYTGASYTLVSDGTQTVIITAEDVVGTTFENTYDEGLNGGGGIVNHFSYNPETGEWTHTATEDSTQ